MITPSRNNVTYMRAIDEDVKLQSGHTIHNVINHVRRETYISDNFLYKAPLQPVISLFNINLDTHITLVSFSFFVHLVEGFVRNHSFITYQPLVNKYALILAYNTRKDKFKSIIKDFGANFHKNTTRSSLYDISPFLMMSLVML